MATDIVPRWQRTSLANFSDVYKEFGIVFQANELLTPVFAPVIIPPHLGIIDLEAN
jgi:hypothetical protein